MLTDEYSESFGLRRPTNVLRELDPPDTGHQGKRSTSVASHSSGQFPSTAWSIVRAAKNRQAPEYVTAMNRFIAGYWRPVFYFIRAKGYPLQRAEDLTQEFFLQCLERDWISKADAQRGRFRTFLLTILTRFLSDQSPRRAPKQRVFDERLVCISTLVGDEERQFEPSDEETPEQVFMSQWARSLVDSVRRRLQLWSHDQGRPDWYEIFLAHHFPPPGSRKTSQEELAGRFRLTRDQVRHALTRMNEQFINFFQANVADQVDSADEIAAEMREIQALI